MIGDATRVGRSRPYLAMEPRPVDVLHQGLWLAGWLLAARRDPGGPWRGLVR
jgi:hypothetical protein